MIPIIIGIAFLIFTIWGMRTEEADALWFSGFMGIFDITKMEHPYLYWFAISTQIIFSLGFIIYGVFQVI